MIVEYLQNWVLFSIVFGMLLLVTFMMMKQSAHFYTVDSVRRKFSILELEIPSKPQELVNVIKGFYLLPTEESKKTLRAVKGQLRLDFLFMPLAYGAIFLLCYRVANKTQIEFGRYIFFALAYLQIIPWICDVIENIFVLNKIKPDPEPSSAKVHKTLMIMEGLKWGLALIGTICAIGAIFYFWLSGQYSEHSLIYLGIVAGEIAEFGAILKLVK